MEINNVELKLIPKENKYFTFLAVFMMLGNVYVFSPLPVLAWGEVAFMIFLPYFIVKPKNTLLISNNELGFFIFIIYSFILTLVISAVFQASLANVAARIVRDFFYYFIVFFLGKKFIELNLFFRLLNYFCIALSIYVILQSVVFITTGYYLPGFLLGVRINDGYHLGKEIYSNYLSYAKIAGYLRPNGFLCEPAHCAQCFFIDLIVLLFAENQKGKKVFLYAGIVSFATLLTMSTSAIVYIVVAWIIWMFKEGKRNILKVVGLVICVALIIIVAYSRGNLNNLISVTNRLTNAFTGDSVTNSTSLRLLKGLDVFSNLPIEYQIFGIGFGTYSAALDNSIIVSSLASVGNEYMNSFSYILVSSGFIGGLILLITFACLMRNTNAVGKATILGLFVVSLGSSIYSSPFCVWTMLVILNSTIPKRK